MASALSRPPIQKETAKGARIVCGHLFATAGERFPWIPNLLADGLCSQLQPMRTNDEVSGTLHFSPCPSDDIHHNSVLRRYSLKPMPFGKIIVERVRLAWSGLPLGSLPLRPLFSGWTETRCQVAIRISRMQDLRAWNLLSESWPFFHMVTGPVHPNSLQFSLDAPITLHLNDYFEDHAKHFANPLQELGFFFGLLSCRFATVQQYHQPVPVALVIDAGSLRNILCRSTSTCRLPPDGNLPPLWNALVPSIRQALLCSSCETRSLEGHTDLLPLDLRNCELSSAATSRSH